MYQNIYFLFQTKKTHTQKVKETKENIKTEETKEGKEKWNVPVVVNNICGKSNAIRRYPLTICVFLTCVIRQQRERDRERERKRERERERERTKK